MSGCGIGSTLKRLRTIILATTSTHPIVNKFHQSKAWRKLAKDHKTLRCACNSTTDIESSHYLPQERFPLMRLWRVNLYISCSKCNGNLGDSINWSIRAIQLLVVYAMIKLLTYGINILIIGLLARYVYLDIQYNASTITHQIQAEIADVIHYCREI